MEKQAVLKPIPITYGSDPEGFFAKSGSIIGSEKVIPKTGLRKSMSTVVLDGVQFELHPYPSTSPRIVGKSLKDSFTALRDKLKTIPEVSCCFDCTVEVSREELDSLDPESRLLGCQPSNNAYGPRPITVDPETYRMRSAGGHLHLGLVGTKIYDDASVEDERHRLPPHMDIFVGNTAVLLDRDQGQLVRRENYGRAGEYRLQPHGLEYRTLSNFWLRNYSLMSFAFGMAQVAVATLEGTLNGESFENELVELVDINKFVEAINTNNYDLALSNFNSIRPFLEKHLPDKGFILKPSSIDMFLSFAEKVRAQGIATFFPESHLDHWCDGHFVEFDTFLHTV